MSDIGMKVNLAGMTKNAADRIEYALNELRRMMGEEEFTLFCEQTMLEDSKFMLRTLSQHATDTAKGEHSVQEFAEFYCLTKGTR